MRKRNKPSKNFLALEPDYANYENSKVVILPVPFEKSIGFEGGSKEGPADIIYASQYLEFYDEETERETGPEIGICTLPELNVDNLSGKAAVEKIYSKVKSLIDDNKFVITLGGEHTLSIGTEKAFLDSFDEITFLHMDAHPDLIDNINGNKFNNSSVNSRLIENTNDLIIFGIRSLSKEEANIIRSKNIEVVYAKDILNNKQKSLEIVLSKIKKNIYITFDVDIFDPSIMPATGTPEPGGLFWTDIIALLKKLGKENNIVGFDIVEFCPSGYYPAASIVVAKLVYKLINYAFN